jgi:hypothetical protein
MTNLKKDVQKTLGNLYGSRTWIEYGFRQVKQELGWTDYRFTKFEQIEKWWELIYSAYLMVSLTNNAFQELNQSHLDSETEKLVKNFSAHQQWNHDNGWKNSLNNLRLIIQPILLLWLISPWLDIFPNRNLLRGFHDLIAVISQFQPYFRSG